MATAAEKLSEVKETKVYPKAALATRTPLGSPSYQFINTMEVVDAFKQHGWVPVESKGLARGQSLASANLGRHMVTFRRPVDRSMVKLDATYPQISFFNGHTAAIASELLCGLWRLACLNGLMVCSSVFEQVKIAHTRSGVGVLTQAIDTVINGFTKVVGRVNTYREIELTADERGVFAEAAAAVRWPNEKTREGLDLKAILTPRRKEDQAPTLWVTFNMLQERLVGGGATFTRESFHRTSKRLESVAELRRVNVELWALTERVARWKEAHA